MNLISISEAAAVLHGAEDVLIVPHVRPDGDAAGSACGLCLGLRGLGKTAYIAAVPVSMRRYEKYLTPYFPPPDFVPGTVVAVDVPGTGQLPPGREGLKDRIDLAIDHHGTNGGYARMTLLEADSASAGELVFLVLEEMGAALTPDMAEALYAAVAADTGCFRAAGTTGRSLAIAARLRDGGFDAFGLTRRLFETKSPARLKLEGLLFGSMRFPRDGVCVMTLSQKDIAACGAEEDDMDKISLLTMVPEGTRAGLFLRQLPDGRWKISLRADGSVNAGEVLKTLGGGGHPNAAGAVLAGEPGGLERAVLAALEAKSINIF